MGDHGVLQNIVEAPEPLYQENPDLGRGEVRQVDWEAKAPMSPFTVLFHGRGGILPGSVQHPLPACRLAVYEYGPGTDVSNEGE